MKLAQVHLSELRVTVAMILLLAIIYVCLLTNMLPEQLKTGQRSYFLGKNSTFNDSAIWSTPSLRLNNAESLSEDQNFQKDEALASLSEIVQAQLAELQSNHSSCKGSTVLCGHHDRCGLACQIHHRMICVALSYAMRIPLIHEDTVGWPYRKKWGDAFQRLGSGCKPGPQTIKVRWSETGPLLTRVVSTTNKLNTEQIEFVLKDGFVVPKSIGASVEKFHGNPFLWWAGQFAKFTSRLTKEQKEIVHEAKISLGIGKSGHATFGLHIRRTDKLQEAADSHRDINEYFNASDVLAAKFFNITDTGNMSIFVASDSHTILQEARTSFPNKRIIGFPANTSLVTQEQRANFLDDIIRDLVILSESEFVVCGFSSNVCRLLLELMSARRYDARRRFISVDGSDPYLYYILGVVIPNNVIFSNSD